VKDNLTLEFSIILSLMLIAVFAAEFHTEQQTELQIHAVNYMMNLPSAFRQFNSRYL